MRSYGNKELGRMVWRQLIGAKKTPAPPEFSRL